MAETRIGTDKSKPAARAAGMPKASAAAPQKAAAAVKTAAPSVVIRRVRKRTDEDGVPAAASTLNIGSRRVSTMVDVAPETLALFDASPFGYASGPGGHFFAESTAAVTNGIGALEPAVIEAPPAPEPE